MQVFIYNEQKDLLFSYDAVIEQVTAVLKEENIKCKEIALYFVTKYKIKKLHKQYFNDPSLTDCISFPIDSYFLGEIFICPYTAKNYANIHHVDLYEELSLYLIHGVLHLIGYDDLTEKDKKIMQKKENYYINFFKRLKINLKPNTDK